jgi:hypothetical protein
VEAQQRDKPLGENGRPGNLFEPVPGDPGAHGDFDDQAHGSSLVLRLSKHGARSAYSRPRQAGRLPPRPKVTGSECEPFKLAPLGKEGAR